MIDAAWLATQLTATPTGRTFALGTLTTVSTMYVTFDGEDDEAEITIPALSSYIPKLNDRVLLANKDGSWVILGSVDTPAGAPLCALTQGTTGTIVHTAAFATMFWDTEVSDDWGFHSTSTNASRVTPTVPGWYLVSGKVAFVSDTNGTGRRGAAIAKNGTRIDQLLFQAPSSAAPYSPLPGTVVQMDGSTDYLEVQAFQESGADRTTIASTGETACFFNVMFLRPLTPSS